MTALDVAIPLFSAAILSAILIPVILVISHRRGWYDHYDDRKVHDGDIPRLAGVGMFLATVGGFFLGIAFGSGNGTSVGSMVTPVMLGVLAGLALVHVTGVIDDFRNIRAWKKLFFQIAAAVLVIIGGTMIRSIGFPWLGASLSLGFVGPVLTVLWLIGISNAVNLMDGIDGLAGGLSLIAALGIGLAHGAAGNWVGVVAALALAGALLGFLFFNFPPARIFMGDGGSLFLGFALAALPFIGPAEQIQPGMFVVAVTVLFLPILDVLSAIIRRLREGRAIHHPDKEHLHHKLMHLGLNARQIDLVIYAASALLAAAGVLAYSATDATGAVIILVGWLVGIALFLTLHYLRRNPKT